ncbi:MAG: TetR/AcrR family transcriptional regulator [Solobacterium sp.]|jgi:AcrR family transcriptional regulator|nr:TetR/AcrR family transcriptional regulator [Solobacterium sp.]MCH4206567.1 TetR/AcrR family transcriptional regulator [Solobacterium sp.]MCH4228025.1 TetR/AcrR family transcriptional regulator [Solobacterium sp.]MCH4283444.1 TetR/AcrR family transcriptional regulator [Solobacterium sp.]
MNREEKNLNTKTKIMESAVKEFASHGYEAASLNVISEKGGISKGIIYHYFASKEDLYLACIRECFSDLTDYLKKNVKETETDDILTDYFAVRTEYFKNNSERAKLFFGSVLYPPDFLQNKIREERKEFDQLNRNMMKKIIQQNPVRKDISQKEIIEAFEIFQNLLNAGFRNVIGGRADIVKHEKSCRAALNIFLYGIVRREK